MDVSVSLMLVAGQVLTDGMDGLFMDGEKDVVFKVYIQIALQGKR